MDSSEIIIKLKEKAAIYIMLEDDLRLIPIYDLLLQWGEIQVITPLTRLAKKYPEKIYDIAKIGLDKGYPQYNQIMGYCYETGCNTDIDIYKAVHHYYTHSLYFYTDCANSNFLIGTSFLKGINGFEKNPYKAFEYFAKGRKKLTKYGQALCYYNGIGCEQDYAQSIKLFKRARVFGYYHIGKCYFYGHEVKQNYDKAFNYFKNIFFSIVKIRKHPFVAHCYCFEPIIYYVATSLYNGFGVKQNYIIANHLFKESIKIRKKFHFEPRPLQCQNMELFDRELETCDYQDYTFPQYLLNELKNFLDNN